MKENAGLCHPKSCASGQALASQYIVNTHLWMVTSLVRPTLYETEARACKSFLDAATPREWESRQARPVAAPGESVSVQRLQQQKLGRLGSEKKWSVDCRIVDRGSSDHFGAC